MFDINVYKRNIDCNKIFFQKYIISKSVLLVTLKFRN